MASREGTTVCPRNGDGLMVSMCLKERGFAGAENQPAENYKFHT